MEKDELKNKNEQTQENAFKQESKRRYSDEAKGVAEVNVKNASASGDGALERPNESLNNNSSSDNAQID